MNIIIMNLVFTFNRGIFSTTFERKILNFGKLEKKIIYIPINYYI